MALEKSEPYRLQLAIYPFVCELPTRYGDLDPLSHVNNVAVAALFEEARLRFALHTRGGGSFEGLKGQMRAVVKDLRVSFLREVQYPEPVTVGVGLKQMGNSSYQIACGMFQGGHCVALSDAVVVCSDGSRSQPLPENVRAALLPHVIRRPDSAGAA